MEDGEKYRKVMEALRRSEPGVPDKELLKSRIRGAINSRAEKSSQAKAGRILDLLFGWVEIPWMRWTVGTAAILLVGGFLVQQVGISHRMARMEKQLIHIENGQHSIQEGSGTSHQVLLRLYTKSQTDSVTVSRADLERLLVEYQQMKEKSNALEL